MSEGDVTNAKTQDGTKEQTLSNPEEAKQNYKYKRYIYFGCNCFPMPPSMAGSSQGSHCSCMLNVSPFLHSFGTRVIDA